MRERDLIEAYFSAAETVSRRLREQPIEDAVNVLFEAWRNRNAVYVIGNGGSASTASHFASDLAKSTIVPGKRRLKATSLVDNIALVSAWTNDSGFATIFAEQLEPWLQVGDVVVAISVHGGSGQGEAGPWSQNLPRALALARERGAKVIGFAGFDGGYLKQASDVFLRVPWDTEPLGTPLIESFQVAIHHLLCLALKIRIQEDGDA